MSGIDWSSVRNPVVDTPLGDTSQLDGLSSTCGCGPASCGEGAKAGFFSSDGMSALAARELGREADERLMGSGLTSGDLVADFELSGCSSLFSLLGGRATLPTAEEVAEWYEAWTLGEGKSFAKIEGQSPSFPLSVAVGLIDFRVARELSALVTLVASSETGFEGFDAKQLILQAGYPGSTPGSFPAYHGARGPLARILDRLGWGLTQDASSLNFSGAYLRDDFGAPIPVDPTPVGWACPRGADGNASCETAVWYRLRVALTGADATKPLGMIARAWGDDGHVWPLNWAEAMRPGVRRTSVYGVPYTPSFNAVVTWKKRDRLWTPSYSGELGDVLELLSDLSGIANDAADAVDGARKVGAALLKAAGVLVMLAGAGTSILVLALGGALFGAGAALSSRIVADLGEVLKDLRDALSSVAVPSALPDVFDGVAPTTKTYDATVVIGAFLDAVASIIELKALIDGDELEAAEVTLGSQSFSAADFRSLADDMNDSNAAIRLDRKTLGWHSSGWDEPVRQYDPDDVVIPDRDAVPAWNLLFRRASPAINAATAIDLSGRVFARAALADDIVLALSGVMLSDGLAGGMVRAGIENTPGLPTALARPLKFAVGLDLPKLLHVAWRQFVTDMFIEYHVKKGFAKRECLYTVFCWMNTSAKREALDEIFGPVRVDGDIELDPGLLGQLSERAPGEVLALRAYGDGVLGRIVAAAAAAADPEADPEESPEVDTCDVVKLCQWLASVDDTCVPWDEPKPYKGYVDPDGPDDLTPYVEGDRLDLPPADMYGPLAAGSVGALSPDPATDTLPRRWRDEINP